MYRNLSICFVLSIGTISAKALDPVCAGLLAGIGVIAMTPASGRITEVVVRKGQARRVGRRHIGYGVMYDFASVKQKFTENERILFETPTENFRKIIEMLNRYLSARYDYSMMETVQRQSVLQRVSGFSWNSRINAESLFENFGDHGSGVCSQKAVVMAAFLNDLGISARVRNVGLRSDPILAKWTHLVVEIRQFDLVADPTAGRIYDTKSFWRSWRKSWIFW